MSLEPAKNPKKDADTIRGLVLSLHAALGGWPTQKQIQSLIGGSGKLVSDVLIQTRAEVECLNSPSVRAIAMLYAHKTGETLTEAFDRILYGHTDASTKEELRALIALWKPKADTENMSKADLAKLISVLRAEAYRRGQKEHEVSVATTVHDYLSHVRTKLPPDQDFDVNEEIHRRVSEIAETSNKRQKKGDN